MAQNQGNGHWNPNARDIPSSSGMRNNGGHRVHLGQDNYRHPRSGPIVCIDPGIIFRARSYWEKCILGYIVDDRKFSPYAIKRIIEDLWVCRGGITIHRMGDLYAFHMESYEDQEDLLARTMVCLDGAVMVIQRWFPGMVPRTVRFPYACMWVRMCGLPFEYLNNEVAYSVGHIFGSNFEVDQFDNVPRNDYLRFRVCMSLGEPLLPGFFLTCEDRYLIWVQFRYEEVFKYCVRCGRVGHVGINCTERIADIEADINTCLQRLNDKGYVVFQAENSHTMFDIDLRALPSTTKYLTSKIRLGNCEGISVPADSFEEQLVDFQLGLIPGGRIKPGMRFLPNSQPFSSVVMGAEVQGNNGEENMEISRNEDHEAQVGIQQEDTGNAVHEDVEDGDEEQGAAWFVPDGPYVGAMDHGQQVQYFEENALILANISMRVEENIETAFESDYDRGYNQTFSAINGGQVVSLHEDGYNIVNYNTEGVGPLAGGANNTTVGPTGTGGWLNTSSSRDSSSFDSTRGWIHGGSSEDGLCELTPDSSETLSADLLDARENISVEVEPVEEADNVQVENREIIVIEDSEDSSNLRGVSNQGDNSMEMDNFATSSAQEEEVQNEKTRVDKGKEIMSEEWLRFYENEGQRGCGKFKRNTISDPKLALLSEESMKTRGTSIISLRDLDKRFKKDPSYNAKAAGPKYHELVLIFDLGDSNARKPGQKKRRKDSKRFQCQAKADQGQSVRMVSAVREVNTYFTKFTKWQMMAKKRKAISDPMLGLVPDYFLKSKELSKQFLLGVTKKMRGTNELEIEASSGIRKQISSGFRMNVDMVVFSSLSSEGSTTHDKGNSEVDHNQPPKEA